MKRFFLLLSCYFHKFIKKIRLSNLKNSSVHVSSKIESGSSFVDSTMDKYSFCGYDCDINMTDIGPYCSIANGVSIGGNAHPIDWVSTSPVFYDNKDSIKKKFSKHRRSMPLRTLVGADVWIGRNAIIKQGVSIGHGAVIGMGAVVVKDVEPYSIVAGNPATLIRKRFEQDIIYELIDSLWWETDEKELELLSEKIKCPVEFLSHIRKIKKKA